MALVYGAFVLFTLPLILQASDCQKVPDYIIHHHPGIQ
jgi:hypothetical protein